ncbi:hypothetical protein NDI47_18330 [Microcoleus vaginatus GB1-A2]|uniref:hypothetical protein n=1 Tax=Microcoleus vaginatus TaxID=119532 RepID=UPI0016888C53|nr:hypothetical protein [Microcoleus sp. FACHB-61]
MKREWRAATLAKLGVTGVRSAVQAGEGKKSCGDRSYPEQESTSGPGNRKADAEFDSTCS